MYRLRLFSACHVGHANTTDSARHQCSSVSKSTRESTGLGRYARGPTSRLLETVRYAFVPVEPTRRIARHFALPVTSHCPSRRTATTLGTKTILFSSPTCQVSN